MRGQIDFFLGGYLFAGCNLDHVAILAHIQTATLQDDVKSLIPRHILQTQGEVTAYGIADYHVCFGEIGNHIQCFANIDFLEIQCQLFAGITDFIALTQLVSIHNNRLQFDDEFIVGLVGGIFPCALGFDHHTHVIALRKGIHVLHRSCKIDHIQFALQIARQAGFKEIDYQRGALLPYVNSNTRIGEVDLDAPFAIFTATKIYVAQLVLLRTLSCLGKARSAAGGRHLCGLAMQGDQQVIAINLGVIGQHLIKVNHQAGTAASLNNIGAAQIPFGEILN